MISSIASRFPSLIGILCRRCVNEYGILITVILFGQITCSESGSTDKKRLLFSEVDEATTCLKRDEIEYRDGNVYECLDPNRPACCEIGRSFTCCEDPWQTAVRNQIWIYVFVVLVVVFGLLLCSCCRGQPQMFKAPTAKQAAHSWKDSIVNKFSRKSQKTGFDVPYEGDPTSLKTVT